MTAAAVPARPRADLRRAAVLLAGAAAAAALLLVALAAAGTVVPLPDVLAALAGTADRGTAFTVVGLRLPRALLALTAGAGLGVAGALFQSITRNPLASPDVIGIQAGATTGVLVVLLVLGGGGPATVAGALLGGAAVAALVTALVPLRQAGGVRFVLVGIAVAALAGAVNDHLATRAELASALAAATWQTGSLNGAAPDRLLPALLAVVLLVPVAALLARPLGVLALGSSLAEALGVPATAVRLAAVGIAVALTAAVTAGAGPLLFVALAAPQIAHRLLGRPGPDPVAAALVGAVLVQAADLIARRVAPPDGLPAGVVTGVVGGIYLAALLGRAGRRRWS